MEIIQKYFSHLSQKQILQFAELENLYKEWNSKINVISRKDIDALYQKHVLHSLSIAMITDFESGTDIIDIGTGGGFPGIPLAIFFPDVNFHVTDSIAKKIKVAEAVSNAIDLKNITFQHIRAEEIKNRKFDFSVSRSVAPLKDLWRWSKPLIKKSNSNQLPNGLITLKGGDLTQEIFESGLRPRMFSIQDFFKEEIFHEKYMLHVRV